MKYWSFWYFLSIFSLILAAICNFETRIPVSQNQSSRAEQDHSNPWLLFCILPCPWLGQQLCPQPAYTSGTGSSLWNFTLSQGVTNLCLHPLAGSWWFPQRVSEAVFSVPQLCPGCRGSPEERHLLALQPGSGSAVWTARDSRNGVCSASKKVWPQQVFGRLEEIIEHWDHVLLHFVVGGHHLPGLELSVNYLLRHFPDLSGSFVLEIKMGFNWF